MTSISLPRDVSPDLPEPIVQTLRRLIQRARTIIVIRGVLAVAAVAIGMLLLVMAVDASITLFSSVARIMLTLSVLAATLAATVWFVVRPLIRTFTLTGIARLIESRHPELEERISSAVELLTSTDAPEIRGSSVLINEVARQASGQVGLVRPEREFAISSARPAIIGCSTVVLILALLLVIWPGQTARLLARAVVPTASIGNVYAGQLTITPGQTVIPTDQSLRIEATIDRANVNAATVHVRDTQGHITRMDMARLADQAEGESRFALTLPPSEVDYAYRVHIGRAVSRFYSVNVVQRPLIQQLTVTTEPPAYTGLSPKTQTDDVGRIEGPTGSRVTVEATVPSQLAKAALQVNGQPVADAAVRFDQASTICTWQFTLDETTNGQWSAALADEHGFTNDPQAYPILTIADRAPSIRIDQPNTESVTAVPTETLPISYTASDDYGLRAMQMLISMDTAAAVAHDLPLIKPGRQLADVLPLSLLDMAPDSARTLTVQLRVTDNRPDQFGGAQGGLSRRLVIHLKRDHESYLKQQSDEVHQQISETLDQAIDQLDQARRDSAELAEQFGREDKPINEAQQVKVDSIRSRTAEAEQAVRRLSEQVRASAYSDMAEPMERTADEQIEPARQQAEMMPLTDQSDQRAEQAQQAEQRLTEAVRQLRDLQDQADQRQAQIDQADQLNRMAAEERELAHQADAADPVESPEGDWQARQQALANQLNRMAGQMPETRQAIAESQARQARDLAEQADRLADEQQQMRRSTQHAADQQAEDAADAAAQSLQRMQRDVAEQARQLARESAESSEHARAQAHQADQQQRSAQQQAGDDPASQESVQATRQAAEQAEQASESARAQEQSAQSAEQRAREASQQMSRQQMAKAAEAAAQAARQMNQTAEQAAEAAKAQQAAAQSHEAAAEAHQQQARENGEEASPQSAQAQAAAEAASAAEQARDAATESAAEYQAARELAARQQQIAEAAKALAEGDVAAANAAMQQAVTRQAEQLTEQTRQLAEQAEAAAMPSQARKPADQASQQMARASQQSEQASGQLAEASQAAAQAAAQPGDSSQAQQAQSQAQQAQAGAAQSQQQAAQSMAQAAAALREMAEQAEAAIAQTPPAPAPPLPLSPEQLAQAAEAAQQAASAPSSAQAAQSAAAAAQAMQQMAQAMGQSIPSPMPGAGMMAGGVAGSQGADQMYDAPAGTDPAQLQRLGLTSEDWTRLPPQLRQQIAQASAEGAPPAYRELVARYFREVARRAAEQEAQP